MVIFHSYINVYQRVKIMIELILIGEKLSACDSVIPHSNGNSQPRWSKSYWFLLCIYIYTHVCNCIYVCIGYILYTLYLPTQTVKCVLSIYAYLHIISSNGRPKYNIMYVCIYIILLYIVHTFWIIQDNMQMYACLHAHIRSRYGSYIADITLHCMTLPDIIWHCATLHIHYMRVCTFYCIYIYTNTCT